MKEKVHTMENERLNKPEAPAADARKPYRKPQLVEYGQVHELTQSGITPGPIEGGIYTNTSG
jgi:hypothetical protein